MPTRGGGGTTVVANPETLPTQQHRPGSTGVGSVANQIIDQTLPPAPQTPGDANGAPPTVDPGHVALGGGPATIQQPQNPQQKEAARLEQDALARYKAGDSENAAKEIQLALKYDPNNEGIKSVSEIIIPHVLTPLNQKNLAANAAGLMNRAQTEGTPDEGKAPQALLASPIAWGAAKAAPGSVPSPIEEFLKRDPAKNALLKMRLRDYGGAEEVLTLQLEKNPTDWLSYRTRAFARRAMKKLQGSFDDATRALALNPKDGLSHDIRASDLNDMNKPQEAISEAEAALKLNPDDAGAYAARAQALQRLNREDEALTDLLRASELDPEFKSLYQSALARREGFNPSRARWAYASAGLAILLLFAGLALGRKSAARTTTSRRAPLRSADRVAIPQGFEIVRPLGEGGMGIVYEAVDKSLERRVALKKMRDEIAGDPRERRRLLKEARTVANLHHPNIVQIYSIVEDGADLFLVFELLNGQTLSQLMNNKPLGAEKAAGIIDQIAAALDHAHAKDVIHRDLKPSNVLVEGAQAKVMDFGIARSSQQTMSTTTRHEIVGTPIYMAPEQEQGLPSRESDVYSLGVCAYEMLSGRLPFPGGGLMQKLKGEFPKLSASGLPAGVDAAIARALDPAPQKRFASAGELARELRRALLS